MGLAMDGAIVEDRAPGFGTNNDALWAAQAYLTPLTVPLRYSNGMLPAYVMEGPARSPATIYPSTTGCFNFLKSKVTNPAEINMTARSDIRDGI